jgi:hypothetical protein
VDEETRRARIAANESVFRSLNEKIEDLNRAFSLATESMSIVCECGDMNCVEQLDVDLATYEHVRSDPTWFVIAPGHEIADVEDIVARHDTFDIVCKHKGAGETVATHTDPRS